MHSSLYINIDNITILLVTLLTVALNKYLGSERNASVCYKTAIFPNEFLTSNLYGDHSCWLVSRERRGEREVADYNWCIALPSDCTAGRFYIVLGLDTSCRTDSSVQKCILFRPDLQILYFSFR